MVAVLASGVDVIRSIKVRVLDSLLSRDAAGGIVDKESIQKIQAVIIKGSDGSRDVCSVPLGEG